MQHSAFLQVGSNFFPWNAPLPVITIAPGSNTCVIELSDRPTFEVEIRPESRQDVLKYLAGVYQGSAAWAWKSSWEASDAPAPPQAPAPAICIQAPQAPQVPAQAPVKEEAKEKPPAPTHKYAIGQDVVSKDPCGTTYLGRVEKHYPDGSYSITFPRKPTQASDLRWEEALRPITPLLKENAVKGQNVAIPHHHHTFRARIGVIKSIPVDMDEFVVFLDSDNKFEVVLFSNLYLLHA